MSPEQAAGRPTSAASDVYGVGVVLYEMLAGRPPFDGEVAVEVAVRHLQDAPPPLPDAVPRELTSIVDRALARSRASATRTGRRWRSRWRGSVRASGGWSGRAVGAADDGAAGRGPHDRPAGEDRTTVLPGGEATTVMPGEDETAVLPGGDRTTVMPAGATTVLPGGDRTTVLPGREEPGPDATHVAPAPGGPGSTRPCRAARRRSRRTGAASSGR